MKLLQLPNCNESNLLSADLSNYGLRPQDWVIKPETGKTYQIQNKLEPDFCFQGVTKKAGGKKSWQSITLKSV